MTKDNLSDKWRERIVAYAPLFLWIGVIFFLSSEEGSAEHTSRIIGPVLKFFFPKADDAAMQLYHAYIRKSAHFAEYAVLAFFVRRAFRSSSNKIVCEYWFLFSLSLLLLVASTDEFNQSFNPERTGSPYDVLLDLSGGLAAMWILHQIETLKGRRSKVISTGDK